MVNELIKLPKRPLGSTGLHVSPLALGTVKIGRNTDVKYPDTFELPDDDLVTLLLEVARDAGINLIDTAPAYGDSELRLGRLLPGNREDWIISTKAGEIYGDDGSAFDFSAGAITRSIEQSLKALKTDYLDIVLIHSDGNDLDILNHTDALDTLMALKAQGKIRAAGISTKTIEGGLAAVPVCDLLMVALNPSDTSQLPVIEAAGKADCGILLKKVFDSGRADPAQCLEFAIGTPGVHAAVVGTINPSHLIENVKSLQRYLAET
jgi:aryl-alcohol dehydrogenase-like predicted oxidoreductase